jgi:hypothetical protein
VGEEAGCEVRDDKREETVDVGVGQGQQVVGEGGEG